MERHAGVSAKHKANSLLAVSLTKVNLAMKIAFAFMEGTLPQNTGALYGQSRAVLGLAQELAALRQRLNDLTAAIRGRAAPAGELLQSCETP